MRTNGREFVACLFFGSITPMKVVFNGESGTRVLAFLSSFLDDSPMTSLDLNIVKMLELLVDASLDDLFYI